MDKLRQYTIELRIWWCGWVHSSWVEVCNIDSFSLILNIICISALCGASQLYSLFYCSSLEGKIENWFLLREKFQKLTVRSAAKSLKNKKARRKKNVYLTISKYQQKNIKVIMFLVYLKLFLPPNIALESAIPQTSSYFVRWNKSSRMNSYCRSKILIFIPDLLNKSLVARNIFSFQLLSEKRMAKVQDMNIFNISEVRIFWIVLLD